MIMIMEEFSDFLIMNELISVLMLQKLLKYIL